MNRIVLSMVAASMLFTLPLPAHGQALKPFAGNWRGETYGEIAAGKREKLKCTAYNTLNDGGMKLVVRCAGAAEAIRITADARENGGKLSGTWKEATFGVDGSLSGTVDASAIKGRISSPNFNASVDIVRTPNGLTVTLTPSSGSLKFSVAMK